LLLLPTLMVSPPLPIVTFTGVPAPVLSTLMVLALVPALTLTVPMPI
jgi:hypothetical protein